MCGFYLAAASRYGWPYRLLRLGFCRCRGAIRPDAKEEELEHCKYSCSAKCGRSLVEILFPSPVRTYISFFRSSNLTPRLPPMRMTMSHTNQSRRQTLPTNTYATSTSILRRIPHQKLFRRRYRIRYTIISSVPPCSNPRRPDINLIPLARSTQPG